MSGHGMSGSTPPALALHDVSIPFGGVPAPGAPGLAGIAFQVAPGERLVLVGGSGEGKTTLLRAVAGLTPVTGGRIEVRGVDVGSLPPERRGAVYLHQHPVLFPHLDVAGNVAFPLRVRGVARAEVGSRVEEALEAVALGDLANRPVATLSGGQRHRVALARAVVARPHVLLLDEPFAALDPRLRHEVRDALLALQARYRPGLVLVTHDLDDAGRLAHRVGIVLGGCLAQLDTPERLFRAPASLAVARFLGYRNEIRLGRGSPLDDLLDARGLAGISATAVVPPGALDVAPAEAPARPGELSGRVVSMAHPGPVAEARVRLEGGAEDEVLEVLVAPGSLAGAVQAGDRVHLRLDPSRVLVFPDVGGEG
jgi:ABC-type Fe3+/spermidine/putrescine transport system ATPase subunit